MSLVALIANSRIDTISDDQGRWRQFVLDHLDYIALRSMTYAVDAPTMELYKYDLRRFLRDNLKRHQDMGWIVQLMNSIRNDFEFEEMKTLIVPSDSMLLELYHSYISITANAG